MGLLDTSNWFRAKVGNEWINAMNGNCFGMITLEYAYSNHDAILWNGNWGITLAGRGTMNCSRWVVKGCVRVDVNWKANSEYEKKGGSIRENNRGTSLTRFSNRGYGKEACIQFAQKWKNTLDRMTVRYCIWSKTVMPVNCVSGIAYQKHAETTQNGDFSSTDFTGWIWSEVMRIVFSSLSTVKTAVNATLYYLHQFKQEWREEVKWKKGLQSPIRITSEKYTSCVRVNATANQVDQWNGSLPTITHTEIFSETNQLS